MREPVPVDSESFSYHAERAWILGNETLMYLSSQKLYEAMVVMFHRGQAIAAASTASVSRCEASDEWRRRVLAQTNAIYNAALQLSQQIAHQRDEVWGGRAALRAYTAAKCMSVDVTRL
ncbi:hypothetical protein [Alicyclobacillus mali (ex Roth et al. 2021)]|uniref:hypothetical protein n=1 Tax=Alicyclobacillus mali (ex Roth et al. 2021) TaxID=1123961 RepID=UPI001A9097ED|nr:hypothetical protein [Alicyclobacillus mali (ex Roth et al. 2021)]